MRWTRRARPRAFLARRSWLSPVAISARAGITLLRVLRVQSQPGGRTAVVVDGGLSDDPIHRASYTFALASRHSMTATQPMTVVGRQGQSGE
jgi:diaminopimelate decarboxylase